MLDKLIDWLRTRNFDPGFNLSLFLLIILLGIWIGSLSKNMNIWPGLRRLIGELMGGLLFGLLFGMIFLSDFFPGVIFLGGLTLALMSFFNVEAQFKVQRLLSIAVAIALAFFMYYSQWGSLRYLFDSMLMDFQ